MTWARTNDQLEIAYSAAFSPPSVGASLDVRRPDGTIDHYHVPETTSFTSDRTIITIPGDVVHADGEVVGGSVHGDFSGMRRGQFFVMYRLLRPGTDQLLAKGYVYALNPLGLGNFEDSRSGMGNRFLNAVANDVTPVDITKALAITNAFRLIHGFIWYYHCSGDTASRNIDVALRNVGGDPPTGMTPGGRTTVWESAGVALTANEEGVIFSHAEGGRDGYTSRVDQASRIVDNTGSQPAPWPLALVEGDNAELFFDVTSPEAADRHSIYLYIEEWLEP